VLVLTPEKKLARTTAEKIIESLEIQGYYLQLPPRPEQDNEVEQVLSHNSKLSG